MIHLPSVIVVAELGATILAVNIVIDSNLITAIVGPTVPLILAYIAWKSRETTKATQGTEKDTAKIKETTEITHDIVNSQRTAMEELIKQLRGENEELRRGESVAETPVALVESEQPPKGT